MRQTLLNIVLNMSLILAGSRLGKHSAEGWKYLDDVVVGIDKLGEETSCILAVRIIVSKSAAEACCRETDKGQGESVHIGRILGWCSQVLLHHAHEAAEEGDSSNGISGNQNENSSKKLYSLTKQLIEWLHTRLKNDSVSRRTIFENKSIFRQLVDLFVVVSLVSKGNASGRLRLSSKLVLALAGALPVPEAKMEGLLVSLKEGKCANSSRVDVVEKIQMAIVASTIGMKDCNSSVDGLVLVQPEAFEEASDEAISRLRNQGNDRNKSSKAKKSSPKNKKKKGLNSVNSGKTSSGKKKNKNKRSRGSLSSTNDNILTKKGKKQKKVSR